MVLKTRPPKMTFLPRPGNKLNGADFAQSGGQLQGELIVVKTRLDYHANYVVGDREVIQEEVGDIIDLGAPRLPRRSELGRSPNALRRLRYTPNPRLYPGPPKSEPKSKRAEGRGRRRKRVYRRPVPNPRLYRPAPPRPRPPPASPWRGAWPPPPAPPSPALATASLAALHLSQSRPEPRAAPPARRLVVTLPAQRNTMDPASRTPDEGSDGNDPVSAPSEFLAEFLSAIMQRQYSEALKYCRLILQYEPHNATARGFYSLLQHKVAAAPAATPSPPHSPRPPTPAVSPALRPESARARCSSSADSSPRRAPAAPRRLRRLAVDVPLGSSHEEMEQEADESTSSSTGSAAGAAAALRGAHAPRSHALRSHSPRSHESHAPRSHALRSHSPRSHESHAPRSHSPCSHSASADESDDSCASQSSLELDSSPSLSLSRRTDHTDSASGSGAGWESAGTPPGERPRDDNGNTAGSPGHRVTLHADDVQNDNDHIAPLKGASASESLRRLRAQFAGSTK